MGDDLESFGEVYSLYVLLEYQRQKIGYALLNAVMECLKKYDKIALWVWCMRQEGNNEVPFRSCHKIYEEGVLC